VKSYFNSVLICVAVALTANFALAQGTTGSIYGTVTDASGAIVPDATITATNTATNISRTAKSEQSGSYSLTFLPVGTYRLEVNANGFKKFEQNGIVLEINRSARVDPSLQVGSLTETVAVNADAPLVNTTDASIGRMVNNSEIINLPLVNRNVYSLLNLTAGVDSSVSGNSLGNPEQVTVINGSSYGGAGSVNYLLDGGNNITGFKGTGNLSPNPDAVQEFRVVTNSFSSEFGRFSGGVVEVITKSGTNAFHGSLFEYLRNTKLNAYPYGALSKAPLHRNQFGGAIGGPIRKDKTFFFGSYSGLRQRETAFANSAIVPTALERNGDFSASARKPRNPANNQLYPGGIIPIAQFDPTARRILNDSIPEANSPGNVFQAQTPIPTDSNEYVVKIDHTISASHQLAGSYFTNRGSNIQTLAGNLPWSSRTFAWNQQNFNASHTWLVSPTAVNQLRLTYVRNFGGRLNTPEMSLGDLGSKFNIQGPPSLPQITVNGYFTLGQGIAGPVSGSNYYGLKELFSLTRGRHSLKFGGEFSLEKFISETTLNNYGTFSFQGNKSGNALADFLLGVPQTMNQDAPINKNESTWYNALFIQDDFRIHPRFVLNLGLRYDLQTPDTDPHNRKLTFIAGRQSTVVPNSLPGLLYPGDPGISRGIFNMSKTNISPRIGFAWDPTGDGKTSVRAAFGMFYGAVSGQEVSGSTNGQPFSIRQQFNDVRSLTDSYGNLPGGLSPFPFNYNPANPSFVFPAGVAGMSTNFRWPYTYHMNFSLQRQLSKDFSVSASYVSTLGHRLPFSTELNYPVYRTGATSSNVNQRRPYASTGLSTIGIVDSIMNTAYHGLQLTAEKRLSRGFSFKAFYTFGKSLEGARLQNDTTAGGAENMTNLALERGRTDNDRRHNFVLSGIWRLDYVSSSHRIASAIANGWTLSTIASLRSGEPLTITAGTDINLDGNNNDRANVFGYPVLDPHRPRNQVAAMWFDTSAFTTPLVGTDGNAGRNILNGPGQKTIDIAIFRDFRLREIMTLQFRADATNAFNMVNLGNPTTNRSSSLFGQIRTARDMRQAQLGIRLTF
jgi:hypothetical protein